MDNTIKYIIDRGKFNTLRYSGSKKLLFKSEKYGVRSK